MLNLAGSSLRLLMATLLISTLAGCSIFDSGSDRLKPYELQDFDEQVKLKKAWSKDLGSSQDARYVRLQLLLLGEKLLATDIDGRVSAYDYSGKRLWRVDLDTEVSAGVGGSEKLVLLGTYKGEVVALSAEDGSELWRHQLPAEVLSPPAHQGKFVAAQTEDGKIFGLDAETGDRLWQFDNALPKLTLRGTAMPVMTDTAVIAGFANGKIGAFNPSNGLILWEQRLGSASGKNDLEKVVDIDGTPRVKNGIVYAGSYFGKLAALSMANGRPIWAKDINSHQSVEVVDGVLYVASGIDVVKALSASSGSQLWSNDGLTRRTITGPVLFGQYVAVADSEGYLHLLDKSTGEFAGRTRVDSAGVSAPLAVREDKLFVIDKDGDLTAYRLK